MVLNSLGQRDTVGYRECSGWSCVSHLYWSDCRICESCSCTLYGLVFVWQEVNPHRLPRQTHVVLKRRPVRARSVPSWTYVSCLWLPPDISLHPSRSLHWTMPVAKSVGAFRLLLLPKQTKQQHVFFAGLGAFFGGPGGQNEFLPFTPRPSTLQVIPPECPIWAPHGILGKDLGILCSAGEFYHVFVALLRWCSVMFGLV